MEGVYLNFLSNLSMSSRILPQERSRPGETAAAQQSEGARTIRNLALERHVQDLLDRQEVKLHQLGGLLVGFAQFDAGGEIDISSLVGDAVGGVELADIAHLSRLAADLFQEFATGGLLGCQAWRQAASWHFHTKLGDELLYAINQVAFRCQVAS
jgi:hypothetical protein